MHRLGWPAFKCWCLDSEYKEPHLHILVYTTSVFWGSKWSDFIHWCLTFIYHPLKLIFRFNTIYYPYVWFVFPPKHTGRSSWEANDTWWAVCLFCIIYFQEYFQEAPAFSCEKLRHCSFSVSLQIFCWRRFVTLAFTFCSTCLFLYFLFNLHV